MHFLPFFLIPLLSSAGPAALQPAKGSHNALIDRSHLAARAPIPNDFLYCAACSFKCVSVMGLCALPCLLLEEIPTAGQLTCAVRSTFKSHRMDNSTLQEHPLRRSPAAYLPQQSKPLLSFQMCCVSCQGALSLI